MDVKDMMWLTALHWACMNGHTEIAGSHREGADINATDNNGFTALYCANGHTEVAKLLMMNGADRINPTDLDARAREYTRKHWRQQRQSRPIVSILSRTLG
jgi:ankyrin repeat protein